MAIPISIRLMVLPHTPQLLAATEVINAFRGAMRIEREMLDSLTSAFEQDVRPLDQVESADGI